MRLAPEFLRLAGARRRDARRPLAPARAVPAEIIDDESKAM